MTKLTLTEKAMTMDEKITYLENYTIITEYLNTDIGRNSHKYIKEQSQVVYRYTDKLVEALEGVEWSLISGESYLELFSDDNDSEALKDVEPDDIMLLDGQDYSNYHYVGNSIRESLLNIIDTDFLDLDYTFESEEKAVIEVDNKEFEYDFIIRKVDLEEFDNDFTPNKAILEAIAELKKDNQALAEANKELSEQVEMNRKISVRQHNQVSDRMTRNY